MNKVGVGTVIVIVFLQMMITHDCVAASYKLKNIKHLYELKSAGDKPLSLPSDVAVNQQYIYVVDGTNHRVVAFDLGGEYAFSIGGVEDKKLEFEYPVGMTATKERLYIADTGHHEVKVTDINGNPISTIKIVSEGKEERPVDVEVSNDGKELFVTCNNSQKIQVYSMQGKLLRSWGGKGEKQGEFRYPATISNVENQKLLIVDVLNARAQMFTNSGEFVREIGGLGVVAGKLFRPKGVAVDDDGLIYISDSYMDVIQVFNKHGEFMHVLGGNNKIQRFTSPAGITIQNQRLYVTEVLENKVSVYSIK